MQDMKVIPSGLPLVMQSVCGLCD